MDRIKFFKKIMEKSNTNNVILITDHYQINGTVYDCEECNREEFINLTDASICKYEETYNHSCEQYGDAKYDWLHINLGRVVAFSFIPE